MLNIFFKKKSKSPVSVTFSGGMGAQIISAAIYFHQRKNGIPILADLSYFDAPEHQAIAGVKGDCSHWSWQLSDFGIELSTFESIHDPHNCHRDNIIADGKKKMELGLRALLDLEIQKIFKLPQGVPGCISDLLDKNYLCIHIRRGDYVNVASHLISNDEFIKMAIKFTGLIKSVVVLSDSPISIDVRQAILANFENAKFLDDTDPFTAHWVMRKSKALICSNSQFSLISAVLNQEALTFIPKQWFSGDDRVIEDALHAMCSFQAIA